MSKIFRIFLVFILFFNCLFFTTIQDSFASSDSVGAKDRLRSLLNANKKGINYTYSESSGFSCKPGGVLFYGEGNMSENVSDYKKCNNDCGSDFLCKVGCFFDMLGDSIVTIGWTLLVEIFLAPVLCISTFYTVKNAVTQKSAIVSFLGPIFLLFVSSGIDKLTEIIVGEDDFNLDPTNTTPICQGLYWTNFAICLVMIIVFKLPKRVSTGIKIAIISALSFTFFVVKETLAGVQYANANKLFDKLALCGDEWLTYGSNDLETYLKNSNVTEIKLTHINSALSSSGNDRKSFPSRGSYFGAYKYALDKCFKDKSAEFCNKIFSVNNITTDTIDNYANVYYKQYREFLYGGVEYANTFNPSCIDPRPERKTYRGVAKGDTKSQLYYFRGIEAANFACDRFLEKNTDKYMNAYKCCLEASQNTICIRNRESTGDIYTFCSPESADGKCSLSANYFASFDSSDITKACDNIDSAINQVQSGFATGEKEYLHDEISGLYYECDKGSTILDINSGKCTRISKDKYDENHFSIPDSEKDDFNSSVENFKNNSLCSEKPENIKSVSFKIRRTSQTVDSGYDKYCVETYNLCPYNFPILGGTEQIGQDFMQTTESGIPVSYSDDGTYVENYGSDNEEIKSMLVAEDKELNCSISEDGKTKVCYGSCVDIINDEVKIKPCFNKPSNLCQIDRHCVYIKRPFEKEDTMNSPYLSTACINFVGSSHNFLNYSRSYGSNSGRLLTAPLVECSVETFKNMLLNRAGHTKCLISGEEPDLNNKCLSGEEYVEGENLEEYGIEGPFMKLQKFLMEIVKVILAIAIVLYGFKIIIKNNGKPIDVQDITKFILTSVFVVYFTMTSAWVEPVFNAIYTTSNYVINLSSKIIKFDRVSSNDYDSIYKNPNYQGCYFFKHSEIPNNYGDYGSSKSYLALFDTLDCKISRYFGITTENIINIPFISFFLAGIFSLGFALITILPFVLLMVGILAIAIKIAFQFIIYSLELTILLFIAPLIIPLYLIDKTKGIFDKWVNQIVGLVFKPMFTILSTMLFLLIFDKYYIGDAKFYGTREPVRDLYCGTICKINDDKFYYIYNGETANSDQLTSLTKECTEKSKGEVIDLSSTSPICIVSSQEKVGNSGSSLFDMIVDGFAGFPAIIDNSLDFFKIFSDIIFLVLLIGIFDKFIKEVNSDIFGTLNEPDFSVSDMLSKASSKIIQIANLTNKITKKSVKDTIGYGIEYGKERKDNKIKREISSKYYEDNKNDITKSVESKGNKKEGSNEK